MRASFVLAAIVIGLAGCDIGDPFGRDPTARPGSPFTTTPNQWTWVDMAGSICANGSQTGVGVNLNPASNDVLIFLQGGGGCWDGATCWGVGTSLNILTGYGQLEWDVDPQRLLLPLQRGDSSNPFNQANMIYVPYCTGDVHAGDAVQNYSLLGANIETHHEGYNNVGLVLDRVKATFPNLQHLWLAGDSAGGFGAALNLDRTQRRFPNVRVDVLDDSGPPIAPVAGLWSQLRQTWNVQLPSDCPECQNDMSALVGYYEAKYPNNRFGLISYTNDVVITTFMQLPPQTFSDELMALAGDMNLSWPNGHYFLFVGLSHVGLVTPTPDLVNWIQQFASDDPAWASSNPAVF